jgi:hypothetical protein
MVTIAYLLLAFVLFIWLSAIVIVVKELKEEKDEWDTYWEEVFKRNANL